MTRLIVIFIFLQPTTETSQYLEREDRSFVSMFRYNSIRVALMCCDRFFLFAPMFRDLSALPEQTATSIKSYLMTEVIRTVRGRKGNRAVQK